MLIDSSDLDPGAVVEVDLCIAGAGAAGIALALEYVGGKSSVCVLEGGGLRPEKRSQDLHGGSCDPPLHDSYLVGSRQRFFGGTSNHWLGYCRPLDAIDFETREWVPHSGWPIDLATLEPYYRRAAAVCQVAPDFQPLTPLGSAPGGPVWTTPFHVHPTRFGERYRDALAGSENVDVLLHSNLVRVKLRADGTAVEALDVAGREGRRWTVQARHYVLALGGIENARMLLGSDDVQRAGIGNERDLVGRFFMDHPVFPVAAACVSGERNVWTEPHPEHDPETWGLGCRPSDAEQRRLGLLNCLIAVGLVPQVKDTRRQLLTGGAWRAIRGVLATQKGTVETPVGRAPDGRTPGPLFFQRLHIRPEPAPNPQSRVTLGEERDPFGQRRAHLSWRLGDLDFATARKFLQVLALEAGRLGLGRIRLEPDLLLEAAYSPGFHHMGTTRMHDDPGQGVVDRHCRVHGVANLHLAGSSVFTTAGYANPTFTLVALALRLADRLKGQLS